MRTLSAAAQCKCTYECLCMRAYVCVCPSLCIHFRITCRYTLLILAGLIQCACIDTLLFGNLRKEWKNPNNMHEESHSRWLYTFMMMIVVWGPQAMCKWLLTPKCDSVLFNGIDLCTKQTNDRQNKNETRPPIRTAKFLFRCTEQSKRRKIIISSTLIEAFWYLQEKTHFVNAVHSSASLFTWRLIFFSFFFIQSTSFVACCTTSQYKISN